MHADPAQANPAWDDRIEAIYISTHGLARCRTATVTIAVISPGEPFQRPGGGTGWIPNWCPAREEGVRLLGPLIESLIPPIPRAEFIEEVRRSLARCSNRIPGHAPPGSGAYAILTMCRGLQCDPACRTPAKLAAAAWAQQELVQWNDLIGRALGWRQRQRDPTGGTVRRRFRNPSVRDRDGQARACTVMARVRPPPLEEFGYPAVAPVRRSRRNPVVIDQALAAASGAWRATSRLAKECSVPGQVWTVTSVPLARRAVTKPS